MDDKKIKQIVKKRYQEVAETSRCCGCESTKSDAELAETIGYNKKDITGHTS